MVKIGTRNDIRINECKQKYLVNPLIILEKNMHCKVIMLTTMRVMPYHSSDTIFLRAT